MSGVPTEVLLERLRDLQPFSADWVHARDLLAADDPEAFIEWLDYMQRQREALREIERASEDV
jgi:hypothetical protein